MGVIETAPLLTRYRLTADDFDRLSDAGVLAESARVELIEGELIEMATIGTRHTSAVHRLNRACHVSAGDLALVAVQSSLRLGDFSEPEPDMMLLRPRTDFYLGAHPTASDVLLLIEVSDSTARYDREIKLPLYARHGVGEVWIVDLDAGQVRFYRTPTEGGYADVTTTDLPGMAPVGALPEVRIDLTGVLS